MLTVSLDQECRKLVMHLGGMLFIADLKGKLLFVNPAWQKHLGYTEQECIGRRIEEFATGSSRNGIPELLSSGGEMELLLKRKEGGEMTVELQVSRLGAEDGLLGLMVDVSERKAAQHALQATETKLRKILSLSPEGVLALDSSCCISFCNNRLAEMLWIGTQKGNPIAGCLPKLEEEWLCRLAELQEAIRSGQQHGFMRLADPMRIIRWEARDFESEELSHVIFFRDITREAEIDRMKSEFLATAAHELRTPMSSIYGFAELMLHRETDERERREFLGIIHEQAAGIIRMLDELLDLARIESRTGKDFRFSQQDLLSVLHLAMQDIRSAGETRKLTLSVPDRELPPAWVDPEKTRQVFSNVLGNACKYSPDGSEIRIEAGRDAAENKLVFSITDSGIGMTPEQVSRIFERFYRAKSIPHVPGAGLGMSLVREIMLIHNGFVEVESSFGSGTCVKLGFPLKDRREENA